jgi:acetyl-CoA carboxylase biotin carboxyl carrier protein
VAQGRAETADPAMTAGAVGGEGEPEPTTVPEAGGEASPAAGGAGTGPAAHAGDLEYVRGLIQVVDASGIDSLEITRAGTRIRISKTPPAAAAGPYFGPPTYQVAPGPSGAPGLGPAPAEGAVAGNAASPAVPAGPEAAPVAAGGEAAAVSGLVEVKSPMVGTFYRAPAPEAPPYVEVGSRVAKGQTLCILEAMKLMNELESEVEGVVRHVLVENAEPVEYGQVLFRIDPAG